jgi:hypothetical protein
MNDTAELLREPQTLPPACRIPRSPNCGHGALIAFTERTSLVEQERCVGLASLAACHQPA